MRRETLANAVRGWRWLAPLAARSLFPRRGADNPSGETHLILAIADHFEPDAGDVPAEVASARVEHWVREYPRAFDGFRDADGRPPRHTFFYPVETYNPDHLDALAGLCRQGFGEVEIHLHHDGDTSESLHQRLTDAARLLAGCHGLLARNRDTGAIAFGFVHGNWALNNARADGRWCGVNDEIRVLRETGCYADFTYPSAPSPTQPPTINRLYHASSHPCHPRGHDHGVGVGIGPAPAGSLLMVPGPLLLSYPKGARRAFPRLENGCIQTSQPATEERVNLWIKAGVRVAARPDWWFVKLHSHGAPERDRDALLGPLMTRFHRDLARRTLEDPTFFIHYVSAREMVNLVIAASSGWRGPVAEARDFALDWNGGECRSQVHSEREINA